MARKGKKSKASSLGTHLAHPLPGVRIVKGKDDRHQVVLGRPGLLSRPLVSEKPAGRPAPENVPEAVPVAVTEPDVGDIWIRGLNSYEKGDLVAAAESWNKALAVDPDCVDAMLGLHALDPSRDELLRGMARRIENFGEMRERFGRHLSSSYRPAGFMIEELDIADDLRRALAIYEHRCGDEAAADRLLEESRPCTLTSSVWARIAFENGDYMRCLQICQKLERHPETAADIDLMWGGSLVAQDMPGPAIEILQRAAVNAVEAKAEMHARYYLALAYEKEHLEDEMTEELEHVYSFDVDFADVASRLGLRHQTEVRPASADSTDPEWEAIVATLTESPSSSGDAEWDSLVGALTGELATDPGIADNAGL